MTTPKKGSGGPKVPGRSGGKSAGRDSSLKVHVKTAHKRTHSSTLWLERQLNDPYVARARAEGWRARAVYKLIEIDERYKLLKPGQKIVDLGAAPGGWAQYAAKQVRVLEGKGAGRGHVIGIDLLEIEPLAGVEFAVMDFLDNDAPERLRAMMSADGGDGLVDGVLSDMAANATGHRQTDHVRIVHLAELAVEFAREVLKPGGFFVAKVLQGGTESTVLAALKRDFAVVRHVKPKASRADSAELYVLATGFRGNN
ncbi:MULTISPECIES: RlmE family RNA methyltransferase [unclassified Beijerinckia]|uniref:RlmE family RNA methyltransferase n=1 Tax=unclassified Beijerinckia TaxID=2638183 RepID=UPI00089D1610|nr:MULTISPECIES: RlmE family RNA methyltransferase [unclassified Beijerinckia]MDH7795787.1 23S rRNA (uridine2552-2'-O)-methyltransferase [Beijerinckia sp. GAS462]SEC16347.1 23S rRNA Um-2552 2'-O-methyltransferase [Beijerinckia sp. 28-YEA-48]